MLILRELICILYDKFLIKNPLSFFILYGTSYAFLEAYTMCLATEWPCDTTVATTQQEHSDKMKGFFILEVRSCTIADVSVMDIEKGS